MQLRTVLVMAATSILMGCAASTTRLSPPEDVRIRQDHVHIELGSLSAASLQHALPRTLARFGYFIAHQQERAAYGTEFFTDWQLSGVSERTRLIVSARPRGDRFAVSVFAVTYVEDDGGHWREARPSSQVQTMLREVSLLMTSSAARVGARP